MSLEFSGAFAVLGAPDDQNALIFAGWLSIACGVLLAIWGLRHQETYWWRKVPAFMRTHVNWRFRLRQAPRMGPTEAPEPPVCEHPHVQAPIIDPDTIRRLAETEKKLAAIELKEHRKLAKEMDEAISFFQTPYHQNSLPNRVTFKGPNHLIMNGFMTLGISQAEQNEASAAKRLEIQQNVKYLHRSDEEKSLWPDDASKQAHHVQIAEMEGLRDLLKKRGLL